MVDPPVKKTVEGNPGADSIFTFKLTARNASSPMPAGSKGGSKIVYVKGAGSAEFGTWSYDEAGVYYYTVSELNTGEKGYAYDTVVYTITDSVKAVNGQLVLSRVVTNALNKQVMSLIFINKYTNPGAPPPIPPSPLDPNPAAEGAPDSSSPPNPNEGDPMWGINGDGSPGGKWRDGMPRTGDDGKPALYLAMLALGALLAIGAAMYLVVLRKRGKGHCPVASG
jgi:pilin isopeptide linkage protein